MKIIVDKQDCLPGEELGPKLGPIKRTRLEYSSLGQIFIKGLEEEEEDKKYRLG